VRLASSCTQHLRAAVATGIRQPRRCLAHSQPASRRSLTLPLCPVFLQRKKGNQGSEMENDGKGRMGKRKKLDIEFRRITSNNVDQVSALCMFKDGRRNHNMYV